MSGADGIQINNLERAVSDDINNLESLKDRNLLEVLKYMRLQARSCSPPRH